MSWSLVLVAVCPAASPCFVPVDSSTQSKCPRRAHYPRDIRGPEASPAADGRGHPIWGMNVPRNENIGAWPIWPRLMSRPPAGAYGARLRRLSLGADAFDLGEMQCRSGVVASGDAGQSRVKVVQHSDKVRQDLRPAGECGWSRRAPTF
jgi:hypothetical protein